MNGIIREALSFRMIDCTDNFNSSNETDLKINKINNQLLLEKVYPI